MEYYSDGLLKTYTTPLGLVGTFTYDELGRRIGLSFSHGGAETYKYKDGVNGKPNMILKLSKRYSSATETPAGEVTWVQRVSAYRADGLSLADIEQAENGRVRVLFYHQYNRNKKKVYTYTPYKTYSFAGMSPLTLEAIFNKGEVPTPQQAEDPDEVRIQNRYDGLGRLVWQHYPSQKVLTISPEPWGRRITESYPSKPDPVVRGAGML